MFMRFTVKMFFRFVSALLLGAGFVSCMDYGPRGKEEFDNSGRGVFIVNEGNFTYGNSTLSFYDPDAKKVENEVFIRSNGIRLGDVAQSMVIRGGKGYITVNNSGIIFIIDTGSFRITGTVTGFTSPRHIYFLSDNKAYVTDLYDSRIAVVDPAAYTITGYIDTGGHKSTEQMVAYGGYVFVNCWSRDNTVLVIDTADDTVAGTIEVGLQPVSMALDKYGKLWVLTDGGYEWNPGGWEIPALYRIDAATWEIEKVFPFEKNDSPRQICLGGDGGTLYFINESVWRMDATDDRLPIRPFIEHVGTIYYGIAADPATGDIYLADAIDYQQPGMVYRYSAEGKLLDSFRAGIIPNAFCFK